MSTNKIVSVLLFCMFTLGLTAQINTYSPYSRFGLGELSKPGFGQNQALGGAGTAFRSNKAINYLNPASYTALDTMSFLFDFGLNAQQTRYQGDSLSASLNNMNFHHLAVAFPLTRWWKAAVGVTPFSSVGYNIIEENDYGNDLGSQFNYFEGNGGINQFFMGTSVIIMDRFSIGLNRAYLFGFLNNSQRVNFPESQTASRTSVENELNIKGSVYSFGFQYNETFNNKYYITLGATYNARTALKTESTTSIQNIFPGSSTSILKEMEVETDSGVFMQTVSVPISSGFQIDEFESEGTTYYPESYTLGLGLGIKNKFRLLGDYELKKWEETSIMGKSDSLVNSSSFRLGMEYTPDAQALRGYFNRVHYRLGGYYSNTYLRILENQLLDYGITFGVGLPFRGTKTTFNLGMVLGQRGTKEDNLIKENYGIINVSFTLHDFWFLKRKFD